MNPPVAAPTPISPGADLPATTPDRRADPARRPDLERVILRRPSVWDVLVQAKRDFVGKDVQQNTTYTYVWSADQGGHFMLGFVPCFIVHWIAQAVHALGGPATWFSEPQVGVAYAAIPVMTVWTALELYDLFDSWWMYRHSSGYFRFNKWNLVWNVVTALLYFSLGAGVAALSALADKQWVVLAIVVLFVLQFRLVGVWWMRIKIIFQQAGLPYLYRLANFNSVFVVPDKDVQDEIIKYVDDLTTPPGDGRSTGPIGEDRPRQHLILSGPQNSGKSSLAAGIGTEFAFNGGIGRYVTMSFLAQYITQGPPTQAAPNQRALPDVVEQEFNDGRILWRWPSVDLLVIDDVVELVLPLRRMFEAKVRNGEAKGVIEKMINGDQELMDLLRGVHDARDDESVKKIVDAIVVKVQQELESVAQPRVFVDYIIRQYAGVLQALKSIPRIVWVLGDQIQDDLFVDFVRQQFGFKPNDPNLRVLRLSPPPQAGPAGGTPAGLGS